MFTASINWLAIVVATIVHMVIGAVWYSKGLFGKQWMQAMGLKDSDMKDKSKVGPIYFFTLVATLVMVYILAHFILYAGEKTAMGGAKIAFWAWLGFVATKSLVDTLFENKNWTLYYISMGYMLVGMLAMGAILGGWH